MPDKKSQANTAIEQVNQKEVNVQQTVKHLQKLIERARLSSTEIDKITAKMNAIVANKSKGFFKTIIYTR